MNIHFKVESNNRKQINDHNCNDRNDCSSRNISVTIIMNEFAQSTDQASIKPNVSCDPIHLPHKLQPKI